MEDMLASAVHKEGDGRRDLHAYTLEVDSKEDRGKCAREGIPRERRIERRSKRLRKREEKG